MKWIVGIDGGGTKTVAYAGDRAGNRLGRAEKGPANYHVTGLAKFQELIAEIIDELCRSCKLHKADLELVSLGLAGVDRDRDRELILAALHDLGLHCRYIVNNDATVALAAGLGKAEGIVLIAGTGSIAYGVNRAGQTVRAGGWGHIISDEGSGYDIGRQALTRGIKAWEKRDKTSPLLAKIMEHIQVTDLDGVIRFVYQPDAGKTAIATLVPVVAAAAREGDALAAEILTGAADDLAALVESVIERGFPGGEVVPVCTYGGVINNIESIRERIAARLDGKAVLILGEKEPAAGALQIGYDHWRPTAG